MQKFGNAGLVRNRAAALLMITFATLVGCQETPAASGSGGSSGWGGVGGVGGVGGIGGVGGTAGTGGGVPGRPSMGSTALPCDIQQGLRLNCQTCHMAQPLAGVPMALMTWEDLQAPAVSNPSVTVAQMIGVRINDPARPMPPAPYTINPIVKDQLNAHVQAGNPQNMDPACAGGTGGVAGDIGGQGGIGGMAGIGGTGGGGTGGTGGGDAGQCYTFPVHAVSSPNDTTPYNVSGQHYACFYFDAPWPDDAQGISFKSKFDSHPEVVHHWLVYLDENDNQPNGTVVSACAGTHPSSPTLVAGWAAGNEAYDLPNDVGLKLATPNKKLLIEYHWYLPPGMPAVQSTSAIEICTATTPRPNTATISWLGSEQISLPGNRETTVTGSCGAQAACLQAQTQDIHIVRSWPHMHKLGTRMESWIVRQNGQRELLFDQLFSFDNQISYPTPAVIHPGDRIETKCHYNNNTPGTVTIGYNTEQEMCFNFTTAYPAAALKSWGPFCTSSSLTSTSTACLF